MKKTREFHDNEKKNISGESIGGAALIRGRRLLTFFVPDAALIRGRRLIEGGAYSSKYGNNKFQFCMGISDENMSMFTQSAQLASDFSA